MLFCFFNEVTQFFTAGGLGNSFTMLLQKYEYHTTQEEMDAVSLRRMTCETVGYSLMMLLKRCQSCVTCLTIEIV